MGDKDTTYNGWTNYPTWCVNLWLSNDESLYQEAMAQAQRFSQSRGDLAQVLKDWVCDVLAPDLGATFAADLLGYALGEVDWHELAVSWTLNAAEVSA